MAFWNRKKQQEPEARSATVAQSSADFFEVFGLSGNSASDVLVTTDTALGVPAVWAAVNFIAGTIAGLPLHLYERTDAGDSRVTDTTLAKALHDAPNDEVSSFEWRKGMFENVLTGGRGFSFIERDPLGNVVNIWPLNPTLVTVKAKNGRKVYEYREPNSRVKVYAASEIIDLPFMLKPDGLGHRGPIATNRDVIALAIAATQFGSKFSRMAAFRPSR